MVDPRSDRALYKQVADILRERIRSGAYPPGELLPSEGQLVQEYELTRTAIRAALAILRTEGLIETERGVGSYVREVPERRPLLLRSGDRAVVDRGSGDPVVVVTRKGGATETHAAEEVEIGVAKR